LLIYRESQRAALYDPCLFLLPVGFVASLYQKLPALLSAALLFHRPGLNSRGIDTPIRSVAFGSREVEDAFRSVFAVERMNAVEKRIGEIGEHGGAARSDASPGG